MQSDDPSDGLLASANAMSSWSQMGELPRSRGSAFQSAP